MPWAQGTVSPVLLPRYARERFLYRLNCSPYREAFVLKEAMLYTPWEGDLHRATRDVDLPGFGKA